MHAQQTDALETEHGLQQARSALLTALGGHDEQLCDGNEQLMSGTPRNGAMHSGSEPSPPTPWIGNRKALLGQTP